MSIKYVSYVRVSTQRQGISGLGLEAQRESIRRYLNGKDGAEVIAEFTEVETGKSSNRNELRKAIELCQKVKATLCIAKLDRLARNLHFVTTLQQTGVQFVACDNPHATPFVIHILCAVAEQEAVAISTRTRQALEAAKRRGTKLGNPNPQNALTEAIRANQRQADEHSERILPVIKELQAAHVTSLRKLASCLNARGLKTRTGRPFAAQTVKNILARQSHALFAS
jgi:DNA invertase Pin-like site-specific DNA recombinase